MAVQTSGTLLLVEDDRLMAMTERRILRKNGYEVLWAESGTAALELIGKREDIHLVLMDIDLGDSMDGTETARRILALRELPIVFLTGNIEQSYVDRVKEITRYGYVLKSSGEFVLIEAISMAFELFRAHQETRRHERQYRLMAENTTDVIVTFDRNHALSYVSPSVQPLIGYSQEEALRLDIRGLLPSRSLNRVEAAWREREAEDLRPRTLELEVIHRDGHHVPVEAIGKPLQDESGKVIGTIGTIRDISERVERQRLLEEQHDRLRRILQGTNAGTWEWDIPGERVIIDELSALITGHTPAEISPIPIATWVQMVHPEDMVLSDRRMSAHIEGGSARYECELRVRHRDGHWVWILARGKASAWDETGRVTRVSGTFQDIDKRKAAEEELQQALLEKQELWRRLAAADTSD